MFKVTMSPATWAAKKQQLATEHNITITADQGTVGAEGYELEYTYDGTVFTGTVTESPRFVPKIFAEHKIEGWLADPIPETQADAAGEAAKDAAEDVV